MADYAEFEREVDLLLETYMDFLDGIGGIKRELMQDALRDYCTVSVQFNRIKREVIETGTTIVNKQGNVVKNPDATTMHQFLNEKNALLPKILKHLGDHGTEPADELAAFLSRG